jgi:putative transposase
MREYEWRTGRKCVYKNFVHLVLVTKYRKNAINNRMLNRMKDLIEETCLQMNCELLEFNGESDHVHLLVSVNPKWSVSNFVGKIKGKTSYFMRKEFWSDVKNKLWGDHFWSPSYCVVSCGGAPLEIVKKYIEDQQKPAPEKDVKKSKSISARKKT